MRCRSAFLVGLWLGAVACGSDSAATPPAPGKAANAKPAADPAVKPPPAASPQAPPQTPPASGHGQPATKEDLSAMTYAEPGKAYAKILIDAGTDAGTTANLTIVRGEGVKPHEGMVKYTAEPKIIVGKESARLDEAKFLGTNVAVDLDGDGATTSRIKVRCDDGVLVLQTKPERRVEAVTEFTEDVVRFAYGAEAQRLIASPTAGAALYSPCGKGRLTFGLDSEAPLKIRSVASPAVFIVYRAKVDAAETPDPFTLAKLESAGEPVEHEIYSFREYSAGKPDTKGVEVFAVNLVVFPIDPSLALQQIAVAIEGETPDFITASINEVDEAGQRIRYADGFRPFGAP